MKKFARVICAIFVAMFALLATGCAGNSSTHHKDLLDRYQKGEITYDQLQEELKNSQIVPMYGTKVLYRPDHYDYDDSVGEGNQEYYGQYAWQILSTLTNTYGVTNNNERFGKYITGIQQYYYDSIRYQVVNQTQYGNKIVYEQVEEESADTIKYDDKYYKIKINYDQALISITADTSYAWNWNFGVSSEPQGFILNTEDNIGTQPISNNSLITNYYRQFDYNDVLLGYYSDNQNSYLAAYLTNNPNEPNTQQEIGNYSDYVKALEYVIYCITMDLTPANITTSLDGNGNPIVNVQGFANVDEALTFIKSVFDRIGTYVGINSYKAARISSYILNNVIGQNAVSYDTVTIASADLCKEYRNSDGSIVTKYYDVADDGTETLLNAPQPDTPVTIGRDYARVVNEIVNDVCTEVHIGSDIENDIITNRFPASEVIDYYGNNFFIASESGKEFDNIRPLEYQSVVLMLSEKQTIDNLMLHFKYDAGMDGDEVYQENASITINVKVNIFTKEGGWKQVKTQTITVKDGEFNHGDESSTLCLFGMDPNGKGYEVGAFKPEVGGGILKCMEYDGTVDISQAIRLVGTTELKNWYKLVEPTPTEEPQNVYYSYGILDSTKFEGEGGCDYMEIAYEVIKTTGDYDTNYKFYTGLGLVC